MDYISGLDSKTFKFIFSEGHKSLSKIIPSIRSSDSEPSEELISIIPSIIEQNLEVHYVKNNKIEIVLYR